MPVIQASEKDYLDVMFLLSRCTANMNKPSAETILKDIQHNSLYMYSVLGVCQGFMVLNENQVEEYKNIDWKIPEGRVLVVHRLAVHPVFNNRDIEQKLTGFAIEYAGKNGFDSLRLDLSESHTDEDEFLIMMGFTQAGAFLLPHQKRPYNCYELDL